MIIVSALRDFANGLSCGFQLFFTERNSYTETALTPGMKSRRDSR